MIIGFFILRIIIMAAMLRLILRIAAKNEADLDWGKIIMVTSAINVGVFFVEHFSEGLDLRYVFALKLALVVLLIMTYLWVSFIRTLVVVGLYAALQFGVAAGLDNLVKKIIPADKHELLEKEVRRDKVKNVGDRIQKKLEKRKGVALPSGE